MAEPMMFLELYALLDSTTSMIRLMEYASTLIGNGGEQQSFLELAHNSDRRHPPHSLA